MSDYRPNIVTELAKAFVTRAKYLGLKGKRRDDAAIEYFIGALSAVTLCDDAKYRSHLEAFISMVLVVRGYRELEEIVSKVPQVK